MAFFDQKGPVSYSCTCGKLKPLYRLYFCRHCFELRCDFCVSSEIDIRYCATCNETLPVTEAWMKGQCCSNCYLCPVCDSGLTRRVTSKTKEGADKEKSESKDSKPDVVKAYYLSCPFCHWTTRDVGLPDATLPSGQWLERENPNGPRINDLVEYFRGVALSDKIRREKKLQGSRRTYTHISGLSAAVVRKRAGLPPGLGSPYRSAEEPLRNIKVEPAAANSVKDDLPTDIYVDATDITSLTSVEQSLRMPETEPKKVMELMFKRKPLMVKQSLRCRVCEHNVIKPEISPNSIKFKIQLCAYYMIPEILIKTVEPLRAGKSSSLTIMIINPTQHPTTISFLPLDYEEPKTPSPESIDVKPLLAIEPPRSLKIKLSGEVNLPNGDIPLPGRDDTAEFDDNTEHPNFNDDASVIIWRKGNIALIKMQVVPNEDLEIGSPVKVGFTLRHIYTNTVILQDKKELKKINHAFKIIFNLGKSVGPE